MLRKSACVLTVGLIASAPILAAQQIFIAPSQASIFAEFEESMGVIPAHQLIISNRSTVPIIVFGVALSSCENIRQSCGGNRVNVRIEPGQRRKVFQVEQKSSERSWNYRWSYSYHPDSSDAKAIAALREHGFGVEPAAQPPVRVLLGDIRPVDTTAPPGIEKPLSRAPITAEERAAAIPPAFSRDNSVSDRPAFRFKVAFGSILGSTMMPGGQVQPTGPCINPQEAARYEADKTITRSAWRPPVLGPAATLVKVNVEDSTIKDGDPLMRFVVDTSGDIIPESVSVLESPHAEVSVAACKSAIQARGTPARDKAGNVVRAWVQMPFRMYHPAR